MQNIKSVRGALKKIYFLKVKTMAEQGGRVSGPAERSNISKYLSTFSLLLSLGGYYLMEKTLIG